MVKLHPRFFREQFGEEMMWIFEEATETHGAIRLLGDGILSLARQWVFRPRSLEVPVTASAGSTSREPAWFAWEHINASPTRLSAGRWFQGGLISLALFSGAWLAATQSTRKPPIKSFGADSESIRSARGLVPSAEKDAGCGSAMGGAYEYRAYAGAMARDLRDAQRRQEQLAVQVESGARVIPGATVLVVGSQGMVPEVPKTPAGEQFSTWLSAFNSGERAQVEEVRKLFKDPPGPNIDADMQFRGMTGGFDLRKIEESSATRMSGLVQERSSDQFARFAMAVEENSPHRITEWHLDAVPTPAEFAIGPLSEALLVEAAKARIEELVKDQRFSGAVLVTKNGKAIMSGAYGLADREKSRIR